MKNVVSPGGFGRFTSLILLVALAADAADHYVIVNGSHFSPAALTIEAGDTVIWENQDNFGDPHTTTSTLPFFDINYWNAILVDPGDTFAHTFSNPGTFNYYDQADFGTGTITVVTPAPAGIVLESPRLEGGQFLFDVSGLTIGKTNVLQASTNLTSWTAIKTNIADSASMTLTNSTTLPRRFFRLLELP